MSDPLDDYFDQFEPTDLDFELIQILTTPTKWQRFKNWLLRRSGPEVEFHTWTRHESD